jgi:hypothetical protein
LSGNESNKESSSFYEEYVDLEEARIWTSTQGSGDALVHLHGGPGGHEIPPEILIDFAPWQSALLRSTRLQQRQRNLGRRVELHDHRRDHCRRLLNSYLAEGAVHEKMITVPVYLLDKYNLNQLSSGQHL